MRVLLFRAKGLMLLSDTTVSAMHYQDERPGTRQTCEALKNFSLFIPPSRHISSHFSAHADSKTPCDLGTQEPMVSLPGITVQVW